MNMNSPSCIAGRADFFEKCCNECVLKLCSIAKRLWVRELDRRKRRPIAEPDETIPDDPGRHRLRSRCTAAGQHRFILLLQ